MKLKDYSIEELENEIARREMAIPSIIQFNYYLHNDYNIGEIQETIANQTGYEIDDEMARKVAGKFYEVKFECVLDTETGELTWK